MPCSPRSLPTMGRLAVVLTLLGTGFSSPTGECTADDTIERDIAIIGGGGAGAYLAISAKLDHGLSAVVIEKESILGGHVNSWTDPATGRSYDCGVQNYLNISGAMRHFDRLGVPMQPNVRSTNLQRFVDFETGKELQGYRPPPNADRLAALARYVDVVSQYRSHMEPGYHNYYAAKDIPAELLMPFGQFIEKYNLSAAVPQVFFTTGFGSHSIMDKPVSAAIRALSPDLINMLLDRGITMVPRSRRNQDIYDRSQILIGNDNILFDSTVQSSSLPCDDASGQGKITLKVLNHKTGKTTKVRAKRLIFTAQPTAPNLAPLALDPEIKSIFSKLQTSAAYVSIVAHPALPINTTLINTPAAAVPQNWNLVIPKWPFHTRFEQYENNSRFYRAITTGDSSFTAEQAKQVMQDALDKMLAEGTIVDPRPGAPPEKLTFLEFQSHGQTGATPTAKDMQEGFFDHIMANNGQCGTFWSGAAFGIAISTSLWQECDVTLKKVKASLQGN